MKLTPEAPASLENFGLLFMRSFELPIPNQLIRQDSTLRRTELGVDDPCPKFFSTAFAMFINNLNAPMPE